VVVAAAAIVQSMRRSDMDMRNSMLAMGSRDRTRAGASGSHCAT
jgi:hypothetical protein